MRQTEVKCDICGKRKGDTNHWFSVSFLLSTSPNFDARPWSANEAGTDICGEGCLHKALENWLDAQRKAGK